MSLENKRLIYVGLNLLLFTVTVWSLIVNTHALKNPYNVLMVSSMPSFLIIGAGLFALGAVYSVSLLNRLAPFIAAAVFIAPYFLPPSVAVLFASNLLGALAAAAVVAMVIKNLGSAGN